MLPYPAGSGGGLVVVLVSVWRGPGHGRGHVPGVGRSQESCCRQFGYAV